MKFIEIMDNPFPKEIRIDFHHINDMFVVPIPTMTHRKFYYGKNVKKHRMECNRFILELYGLNDFWEK